MTLSVNYNPSVLTIQRNLSSATNSMTTALERMSTGFKINSAKDDAAGLYVATNLNTQIRGLKQAQKNVNDGISLLSTADGSLSNMTNIVYRLRDLAVQSSNGVYDDASRKAMQDEADELTQELYRLKNSTTFNVTAPPPESVTLDTGGIAAFGLDDTAGVMAASLDVVPDGYTAINTAQDLDNIRNNLSGKYILMADIDLSSISNWDPLGDDTTQFTGTFDGNGHVIKNLTIDRINEYNVGLFEATSGATISNVGLENVNVKGQNYVGGLLGQNYDSTVSNSYATGSVTGTYIVGGLVGQNYGSSTVSNSYATGSVTGTDEVGGLVGYNSSSTAKDNNFNTETTGQTNAIGTDDGTGTISNNNGLTTAQMQNADNWTGWDTTIWDLSTLPPRLAWQPQPPTPADSYRLQVGANADESSVINFDSTFSLGVFAVDFTDTDSSAASLNDIDELLNTLSAKRADFGAILNRLDSVLQAQTTSIENYTAAKSTIMDADIAQESANYVKSQILQQTSAALLVQAQQTQSSLIMSLIR